MTVVLSGFADEISPDPDDQLATLLAESITHLELRSAWSVNVADFTDGQVAAFRGALDRAGVRVSAIGSPIGKIPLEAPLGPELDRMRRIADIAGELGTTIVRVFSFFIPPGEPPQQHRERVIDRMTTLAQIASERGLVLAHEPAPAVPLVYLQVKDALAATGEVVPAGQGDGQVRQTLAALRDSDFEGFVSLEPHLAQAGRYGGFSGPEGFARASQALKSILNELAISWR
ncbi:MAG: TIM barrel protein [Trebonia sp.]